MLTIREKISICLADCYRLTGATIQFACRLGYLAAVICAML
jgi:hypothetical protein